METKSSPINLSQFPEGWSFLGVSLLNSHKTHSENPHHQSHDSKTNTTREKWRRRKRIQSNPDSSLEKRRRKRRDTCEVRRRRAATLEHLSTHIWHTFLISSRWRFPSFVRVCDTERSCLWQSAKRFNDWSAESSNQWCESSPETIRVYAEGHEGNRSPMKNPVTRHRQQAQGRHDAVGDERRWGIAMALRYSDRRAFIFLLDFSLKSVLACRSDYEHFQHQLTIRLLASLEVWA